MTISSTSLNPSAGSPASQLISNAATPPAESNKPDTPTPSTVVTLSAQARQLNNAQTGTSNQSPTTNPVSAIASQTVQAVPKEANEAPGIQLITGDIKNGRVSTYA